MAESDTSSTAEGHEIRFAGSNDQRRSFRHDRRWRDSFALVAAFSQVSAEGLVPSQGFRDASTEPSLTPPVVRTKPPSRPIVSPGGVSRVAIYSNWLSLSTTGLKVSTDSLCANEKVASSPRCSWRFYVCFTCICIMNFMTEFSVTALCTSLPTLSQDLRLSTAQAFWIPGSFLLSSTILQPLCMRLSPTFGCKNLLACGTMLLIAGSALSAMSQGMATLIAGRVLEGAGTGAIAALSSLILMQVSYAHSLDNRLHKHFETLAAQASWLGFTLGPVIGAALTQYLSWRAIFTLQMRLTLFTGIAFVSLCGLPNMDTVSWWQSLRKVDYTGWLLLSCSIAAVLMPASGAGALTTWTTWQNVLPLSLGVLGLTSWILYNRNRIDPILPVSIFGNETALFSGAGTLIHGTLLGALVYLSPVAFPLPGTDHVTGAVYVSVFTLPLMLGSVISAFVLPRSGYVWATSIGWALATAAAALSLVLGPSAPSTFWIPVGMTTGLALGILAPALQNAISSAASTDDETIHSTPLYTFIASLGRTIGMLIGSSIFLNSLKHHADGIAQHALSIATTTTLSIDTEQDGTRPAILEACTASLRTVLLAGCIAAGFSLILSLCLIISRSSTAHRRRRIQLVGP